MSSAAVSPPRRLAVILFNLGGPDSLDAVRPFLFNLFNDKAIIRLPAPLRTLLASIISSRRTRTAKDIYKLMGGASTINPETEKQADALKDALLKQGFEDAIVIPAMRYAPPRAEHAYRKAQEFNPDAVILLPLYPQFSTTTSQSSLDEWRRIDRRRRHALRDRVKAVCCYHSHPDFIEAHALSLRDALAEAPQGQPLRILFSAHGLPQNIVDRGDPYPRQIRETAEATLDRLKALIAPRPLPDWRLCYQSRVGPLQWLKPDVESEIQRAAQDGLGLVIVPISFVSEHSETLVELDIEYKHLADEAKIPFYLRVPTLGVHPFFIKALAALTQQSLAADAPNLLCPKDAPGHPCCAF